MIQERGRGQTIEQVVEKIDDLKQELKGVEWEISFWQRRAALLRLEILEYREDLQSRALTPHDPPPRISLGDRPVHHLCALYSRYEHERIRLLHKCEYDQCRLDYLKGVIFELRSEIERNLM